MKKFSTLIFLVILLLTMCKNPESDKNLKVNGSIEGLKKGTVYLHKMKDTLLITVDSTEVRGSEPFWLYDHIEEPEIYTLTVGSLKGESILFFAEEGEIKITAQLSKFLRDIKVEGSNSHAVLEKYDKMIRQFSNRKLELIKEKWDAQIEGDTALVNKKEREESRQSIRQILFTGNYAIQNAESEVAPYLALTQLSGARKEFYDTIYKSLSVPVKNSKYGKKLKAHLELMEN